MSATQYRLVPASDAVEVCRVRTQRRPGPLPARFKGSAAPSGFQPDDSRERKFQLLTRGTLGWLDIRALIHCITGDRELDRFAINLPFEPVRANRLDDLAGKFDSKGSPEVCTSTRMPSGVLLPLNAFSGIGGSSAWHFSARTRHGRTGSRKRSDRRKELHGFSGVNCGDSVLPRGTKRSRNSSPPRNISPVVVSRETASRFRQVLSVPTVIKEWLSLAEAPQTCSTGIVMIAPVFRLQSVWQDTRRWVASLARL